MQELAAQRNIAAAQAAAAAAAAARGAASGGAKQPKAAKSKSGGASQGARVLGVYCVGDRWVVCLLSARGLLGVLVVFGGWCEA